MVLLDSVGFRGDLWKPVGFTGRTVELLWVRQGPTCVSGRQ